MSWETLKGKFGDVHVQEVDGKTHVRQESIIDGRERTMEFAMPLNTFRERFGRWRKGELLQNAFHGCSASQREFIMTGMTDEQWDETVPQE
jgi:hypothetical protein